MIGTSFGNSASSGDSFSPADIAGLKLWLDSDAANINAGSPTNLDAVSTWIDKSTSTNDFSQGTALSQPIWKSSGFGVNSKPYLEFDGTSDFLAHTPSSELQNTDFSLIVVANVNGVGQSIWRRSYTGSSFDYNNENIYGSVGFQNRGGTGVFQSITYSPTNGIYIIVFRFNSVGVGTSIRNIRFNAVTQVNETNLKPMNVNGNDIFIGTTTGTSSYTTVLAAEYLYYDSYLLDSDVENLETYLNAKYAAY